MIIRYTLFIIFLLFIGCTKEGLPGPQGPQGPEGPAGTGGGGTLKVITYTMPVGAQLIWEKLNENATQVSYRFKYILDGVTSETITLPDSVTKMIDDGSLLIYGHIIPSAEPTRSIWHQFEFSSANYVDLETYRYNLEKTNRRYRVQITGNFLKREPSQVRTPIAYTQIKFVIIPPTDFGELEVGE